MNLKIIVAMDRNQMIGKDNDMPWQIPEDLAHFKQVTMGHTIIMGRKTYLSIGKALPGRKNVVLTRDTDFVAEDTVAVHDLQKAAEPGAFVIGGASVYEQALPLADMLYITHIDAEFEGDRHFPKLDWAEWRQISSESLKSDAGYQLRFAVYKRIKPGR